MRKLALKRTALLWLAIIVSMWTVFVLCAHWEPILRDGWGHYQWHRQFATTFANVWAFAYDTYLHGNPRPGQVLTLLLYTPGPYHLIITPVVELLVFWILTVLALGRRPRLGNTQDALMYCTITAMGTIAAPLIGPLLFYRPFVGNYVFGFILSTIVLIPYRIHAETPAMRRWWWAAVTTGLGLGAGMANEHIAPTIAVLIAAAIAWFAYRGERIAPWMIAGLMGVIVGGLALYYAPGQALRYHGLANGTMIDRIEARTLFENVRVVLSLVRYALVLLPWLVLGGICRWLAPPQQSDGTGTTARRVCALAMAAAAVGITLTLLVSPKQGLRLYFAPVCFVCAAVASVVVPMVRQRATRLAAWLLAAATLCFVGTSLVVTYHTVGAEFAIRLQAITRGAPNSVVKVRPYTVQRSHWFLGEDFGAERLRASLAFHHGLAGIVLDQQPSAMFRDSPGS